MCTIDFGLFLIVLRHERKVEPWPEIRPSNASVLKKAVQFCDKWSEGDVFVAATAHRTLSHRPPLLHHISLFFSYSNHLKQCSLVNFHPFAALSGNG